LRSDTAWFGILAKSALSGLAEYNAKSEILLQNASQDSIHKIEDEIHRLTQEKSLSVDEQYAEWSIKMQEHEGSYDILFTNFYRYSFIILAYAVLEDHLYRLCVALYDAGRVKEPFKNCEHNLKSYRSYIDKAAASIDVNLWESAENLRYVRNCVAHNSGDVSRSR
jgi:hypothetical protein